MPLYRAFSVLFLVCILLAACGNVPPVPATETNIPLTPTSGTSITPIDLQSGYGVRGAWFELYFTNPASPLSPQGTGGVDGPIVDAIDAARLSVDVAAYSLSLNSVRNALICAGLWAITMGLFPLTANYPAAVTLLVVAGIFSIAFTSMAQTIVQLLAPAHLRGRLVGLFNTAMLGLRAGAGLTVGIAGAFIGVRLSLALSSLAVLIVAAVLLARDSRRAIS